MISILEFFKDNFEYITIGSILLFTLLVIFSILKIDFKDLTSDSSDNNTSKVVTIESMDTSKSANKDLPNDSFDATFCRKHESEPHKLEKKCKSFNKEGCSSTSCCVWVKHDDGEECVAGNIHGQTFHGTEDEPRNVHYHEYKGACVSGSKDCSV